MEALPLGMTVVVNSSFVLPDPSGSQRNSFPLRCIQETVRSAKNVQTENCICQIQWLCFGACANLSLLGDEEEHCCIARGSVGVADHGRAFLLCQVLVLLAVDTGTVWTFVLKAAHPVLLNVVPHNLLGSRALF